MASTRSFSPATDKARSNASVVLSVATAAVPRSLKRAATSFGDNERGWREPVAKTVGRARASRQTMSSTFLSREKPTINTSLR